MGRTPSSVRAQVAVSRRATAGRSRRWSRAAVACGIDALFVEVHPDPDSAPSDGPNSLNYDGLIRVLDETKAIRSALDRI